VNGCAAPSSTATEGGAIETETSLVMVTTAVAFLDESATLVACTNAEAGAGRLAGAV
jgi:hypothetical protein